MPDQHFSNSVAPLLSIHLSSNRPGTFISFLDCLQAATDDMAAVEVVVKIDDADEAMNRVMAEQIAKRPFRLKYISTPLDGGFYGLWRCYDDLLQASDPNSYFVVGLNDEMSFRTKRWDATLRKYVGLFPDHIFRLRTSVHRYRNYHDFWEAGFANDTSAIMTRRWLVAGGGWCPCNGPDTFQQFVAFYFGWLDRFNANRMYRELPIDDIAFDGHGANVGLSGSDFLRRWRQAVHPWFVLVSHRMQEEAARRAQRLRAHIWAHQHGAKDYELVDNQRTRRIQVMDATSRRPLSSFEYRLSRSRIGITNWIRGFNYLYYGGGGSAYPGWRTSVVMYMSARYPALDWLRKKLRMLASWRKRALRKMRHQNLDN
jgi:hypothetical protein